MTVTRKGTMVMLHILDYRDDRLEFRQRHGSTQCGEGEREPSGSNNRVCPSHALNQSSYLSEGPKRHMKWDQRL